MPLWVSRDDLPPLNHELRLIYEGQGAEACKTVLESRILGAPFREHAESCPDCGDIVRELYGDGEIPVGTDLLTFARLQEFLEESHE